MAQRTIISQVGDVQSGYGEATQFPQNHVLYADAFKGDALAVGNEHEVFSPRSIDDVFDHYGPTCNDVELQTEDGETVLEDFHFEQISDFDDDGLIAQSPTLSASQSRIETLNAAIRQVEQNRDLKRILSSDKDRRNLFNALISMQEELKRHI